MSKFGPKGPWKVKGRAADVLVTEHEKDPSIPSHILSQRVFEETGVYIAPRTVRHVLQMRKRGRLYRQSREAQPLHPILVRR